MTLRRIVSWISFPVLVVACTWLTATCLSAGINDGLIVAMLFIGLASAIALLEAWMPHERAWQKYDGEFGHDVVFTLLGSGLAGNLTNALVVAIWTSAAVWLAEMGGGTLWPVAWPVAAQVALTLVVAEFGAYWAHRINHESSFFWRFHAIHHNVSRLWWMNSGRNHPLDTALIFFLSLPLLILLGAPGEMMVWLAAATTVFGMISHSNAEMRCGVFDWIFNTPGVHRWHHSRNAEEGNRNYGENLMIWDVLFGTHYRSGRRPPVDIGSDTSVPDGIWAQIIVPILGERKPNAPVAAIGLLLAATLVGSASVRAEAQIGGGADELVEKLHSALIESMQKSDELDFDQRFELLAPVVDETYDVKFMARATIGSGWTELTSDERRRWSALVRRQMISTYARQFVGFSGERFETGEMKAQKKGTIMVSTLLYSPGEVPIQLDYRVRETKRGWRIMDVYFDGSISELSLRRAQYTSRLKSADFDTLCAELDQKLTTLAANAN